MNPKTITDILSHPISIALILGSLFLLLLPLSFPKYKATLVDKQFNSKPAIDYHDLNEDGNSEKIWFEHYKNNPNALSLLIGEKNKIVDQWNFKGDLANFEFFDYDHDGLTEIFIFSNFHDSVLLNVVSPFKIQQTAVIKNYFVEKYKLYNGNVDHDIQITKFSDRNNDGFSEINFAINSGLNGEPRRFYSFDLANSKLVKSPFCGITPLEPIAFDIDKDGKDEYIFSSQGSGNLASNNNIPYPDTCTWLMVLDDDLSYLFKPVPIGQYKTYINVVPFKSNGKVLLCVLKIHHGTEDVSNELRLYDLKGNLLKWKIIDEYGVCRILNCNTKTRDKIYMISDKGFIYKVDGDLKIEKIKMIRGISPSPPVYMIDLDQDENGELLLPDLKNQYFIITRNNFSYPIKILTPNRNITENRISVIKEKRKDPLLFFDMGNDTYTYRYGKNPIYYLKYPFYLAVYLMIYLIVLALQYLQNQRAKKHFETQKKITELQLVSAKNQMSPHFTLNLVQSIAVLFDKKDHNKAMEVFSKYTRMLRDTLINSDQILVTLQDELEYVKNYLDLEQFRYSNKFEYQIEVSEDVNQNILIPKMLIHTFVENAVKHGIKHLETKGMISIEVNHKKDKHLIIITDNGVGREKAQVYAKLSTGKGLEILNTIIAYHKKMNKTEISYRVTDLFNNFNEPAGTEVLITIPG